MRKIFSFDLNFLLPPIRILRLQLDNDDSVKLIKTTWFLTRDDGNCHTHRFASPSSYASVPLEEFSFSGSFGFTEQSPIATPKNSAKMTKNELQGMSNPSFALVTNNHETL